MVRGKVFSVVKEAIQDLNEELDYDNLRSLTYETPIFGEDGTIDSLSLVRLIVSLEQQIEVIFSKNILLADEKAISLRNSPFRRVGSMVDYIIEKLEDNNGSGNDNNRD